MIKIDWGGRPLDPPLQSKPQNLRSVCRIFLQFLNCWRIEEGWSYLLTCITITGFVHMGGSPLHPDGLPISLSYLKHFAKKYWTGASLRELEQPPLANPGSATEIISINGIYIRSLSEMYSFWYLKEGPLFQKVVPSQIWEKINITIGCNGTHWVISVVRLTDSLISL